MVSKRGEPSKVQKGFYQRPLTAKALAVFLDIDGLLALLIVANVAAALSVLALQVCQTGLWTELYGRRVSGRAASRGSKDLSTQHAQLGTPPASTSGRIQKVESANEKSVPLGTSVQNGASNAEGVPSAKRHSRYERN